MFNYKYLSSFCTSFADRYDSDPILASNAYFPITPTDPCNTLHNQVITSQCASLVKTTNFNFAGEGNPEWFCAENSKLGKG